MLYNNNNNNNDFLTRIMDKTKSKIVLNKIEKRTAFFTRIQLNF